MSKLSDAGEITRNIANYMYAGTYSTYTSKMFFFAMSSRLYMSLLYPLLYPAIYVVLRESMSTVRSRAHSIQKLRGLTMHR